MSVRFCVLIQCKNDSNAWMFDLNLKGWIVAPRFPFILAAMKGEW